MRKDIVGLSGKRPFRREYRAYSTVAIDTLGISVYFCGPLYGQFSMVSLLVIFFTLSIFFSFLCSIWEAVLLSITPSFISAKEQQGIEMASWLKDMKSDIDRPLSAILTLNTIAHTVGAIGVGIQAGHLFGDTPGPLGISWESIIAGLMTLAILVLSEIIPKTLGANYWRRLSYFTVQSLRILLFILAPFVWFSQLVTKNLKKDKGKSVFSRADLHAMTLVGEESGMLKTYESSAIKNVLKLDTMKVKDIMTPRVVMLAANGTDTLRRFYENQMPIQFSRIPVFEGSRDNVTGIMLKDDLLQALLEGKDEAPVSSLVRKVLYVNENMNLMEFQNAIMPERGHMAIVVDGFGAVRGLATMEDLFETILDLEIVDETDEVDDLQKMAREIWHRRAKKLGLFEKEDKPSR